MVGYSVLLILHGRLRWTWYVISFTRYAARPNDFLRMGQTIVATAIPRITDEFKSIADVGWYGSAFFLTFAAYQSAWGKVYKYFSMKHAFFCSVVVFGIGTLICGKLIISSAFLRLGKVEEN